MPVAAMSPEDQTSAIANMESTLHAILEEKNVRRDVEAKLAQLEVSDCETFSLVEGTVEKLRGKQQPSERQRNASSSQNSARPDYQLPSQEACSSP